MIPKFELYVPKTVKEVCGLLKEIGRDSVLVAGGTDVFVEMHNGVLNPLYLIDLKKVQELTGIKGDEKSGLDIGAMTTHHEIETNPIVRKYYSVLYEGVNAIGSLQVRNRATIGGNICTAAPSADGIGPLLVLNAVCFVEGSGGSRKVPLIGFFPGPKRTVLAQDEILARILVPPVNGTYGAAFFKYGRRKAMEIALMGITAYVETEADGVTCRQARIALATSAPTPIRAGKAEAYLRGKNLADKAILEEAGRVASEEAKPRGSWRSSMEFRKSLLENLVPRTLMRAYENMTKG